jgi:Secretion system C-terminal sorting domain
MTMLRQFFVAVMCLLFSLYSAQASNEQPTKYLRLSKQQSGMANTYVPATLRLPVSDLQSEFRITPTRTSHSLNLLNLLSRRMRLFDAATSADTSKNYHRLEVFTNNASELGTVRLTLGETQAVEITAFNILGKRVMDIYTGEAKTGINALSFDVSQLSHGMYICVVRGQRFKIAEKFLVSR